LASAACAEAGDGSIFSTNAFWTQITLVGAQMATFVPKNAIVRVQLAFN